MPGGTGALRHSILAIWIALWSGLGPASAEPQLTLTSNVVWQIPQAWFGGFSAVEASADGTVLTLLSDRNRLVTVRIYRTDGRIDSVQLLSQRPLLHANGSLLKGPWADSEGLAISADGQAFVSFEFRHRVASLSLHSGRTTLLPAHPDFAGFETNKGLEALAIHPDGRLFALSEAGGDASGTTPLYAYDGTRWMIADRLPANAPFRPVGADFDTAGRLYLLERTLSPLGFRSRIRRFDLTTTPPTGQTLLTTLPGTFDNLEGISLWQDHNGETRLTLISDDNFLPIQKTQIVEFLLTE